MAFLSRHCWPEGQRVGTRCRWQPTRLERGAVKGGREELARDGALATDSGSERPFTVEAEWKTALIKKEASS